LCTTSQKHRLQLPADDNYDILVNLLGFPVGASFETRAASHAGVDVLDVNTFNVVDTVVLFPHAVLAHGFDGHDGFAGLLALLIEHGSPLAVPVQGRVSDPEVAAVPAVLACAGAVAAVLGTLGVEFVGQFRLGVAITRVLAALGVSKVLLRRFVADIVLRAIAVNHRERGAALGAFIALGALWGTVGEQAVAGCKVPPVMLGSVGIGSG